MQDLCSEVSNVVAHRLDVLPAAGQNQLVKLIADWSVCAVGRISSIGEERAAVDGLNGLRGEFLVLAVIDELGARMIPRVVVVPIGEEIKPVKRIG